MKQDTTITVTRFTAASNGRGKKTQGTATTIVAGLPVTKNYHFRRLWSRAENGPPQIMTTRQVLFFLHKKPFPAIVTNDIVTDGQDSKQYKTLLVRRYQYTMQLEVEDYIPVGTAVPGAQTD